MALSNWATLAFGPDGQLGSGVLKNDAAWIEIYKNWLVVHSEKMWCPEMGDILSPNIIATVDQGQLFLAGFHLSVKKHRPQNSVFVYARSGDRHMAGIGCYAYSGQTHIGVRESTFKDFRHWLGRVDSGYKTGFEEWLEKVDAHPPTFYNQGDSFLAHVLGIGTPITELGEEPEEPFVRQLTKARKGSSDGNRNEEES